MKYRLLFLLLASFGLTAYAQNWSSFLDGSRAVDWSNAGFTIPAYSVNCSVQPTLTANSSGAASANAVAIQNALNSCDATHNVVNIPAGTYYVNGFTFGGQGHEVLRGAGGSSTYLYMMTNNNCGGLGGSICMIASNATYGGSATVLPPGGTQQCSWTAGYAQGTTTVTVNNCPGGPPPPAKMLILDQANDTNDNGGIYMCDGTTSGCTYEGTDNSAGRTINGTTHSELQIVYVNSVTSLGGGSYSVNISPGIYFTNIRSSQNPGAWWAGFVQNDGIENMTLDYTYNNTGAGSINGVTMLSCYQCWMKGVRNINAGRAAAELYQTAFSVVRDSYFYGAAGHAATSYNIELDTSSANLIENNISQQTTLASILSYSSAGNVIDYNFSVDNLFAAGFTAGLSSGHSTANNFNLFEGNDVYWIDSDNASGPSDQQTLFRNFLTGLDPGRSSGAIPFHVNAYDRDYNLVGNVLGQPGFHTIYQIYAVSTSAMNQSSANSIYSVGEGGTGGSCTYTLNQSTACDPVAYTTLMRWGNYDVVNAATQWNATEASPGANAYVNPNFTSTYFSSLAHTLPASLYYSTKPSWWPSGKNWPPVGPDVNSGNIGMCNGGTYDGSAATNPSQCTGGTFSVAWSSHSTSIPAMDCYLNTMGGPPDGSGSVLNFNANACYSGSGTTSQSAPESPTSLVATVY